MRIITGFNMMPDIHGGNLQSLLCFRQNLEVEPPRVKGEEEKKGGGHEIVERCVGVPIQRSSVKNPL